MIRRISALIPVLLALAAAGCGEKGPPAGAPVGTPSPVRGKVTFADGSALGREELTIDLREWAPTGIPALKASAADDDTTTYLCVLPARLIADLYGRYGGRLLQGNVRSYLSNRGKVNRGAEC